MTDDELTRAIQDARDTAASAEPLDAERVWRAAKGQLTPEETALVLDRVAADPVAFAAWRLARELPDDPVVAVRPANGARWFGLAAAVALAAAIAVGARAWWTPPADVGEVVYRGTSEVVALDPVVVAPGADAVVRWSPVDGARYTLLLSDAELRPVHALEALRAPEGVLPADVLARLPGGRGFVQLVVTTVDGDRRSAPTAVTVGP